MAITPISTTTAPTMPLAIPQKVHTSRVATASDAGSLRKDNWTALNILSTSAARSMT